MIAKITSGSGFGGTERYIEDYNGRDNKIVEELDHKGVDIRIGQDGQLQVNPAQVALSFREQADLNPNVSKPVGHTCLSFHPKDATKLTNEKMLEIALKYMDRMGIKDTQYHIVRHNEKNNPHCHIVWNRVDENGKRYNDSNERKRSVQVCKQLTKEYGLTMGEHKSISKSDVNEQRERTRYDLCQDIYQSLARTRSLDGLQRDLQRLGIETQIKRDSNGNPRGISFSRDGQVFKGSEVDRKLSCWRIQKFYDNRQSIFGNNGPLGNNGSSGNNNFNSLPDQSGKDKLDVFKESVAFAVDIALTALEDEGKNAKGQSADKRLMQQIQQRNRSHRF